MIAPALQSLPLLLPDVRSVASASVLCLHRSFVPRFAENRQFATYLVGATATLLLGARSSPGDCVRPERRDLWPVQRGRCTVFGLKVGRWVGERTAAIRRKAAQAVDVRARDPFRTGSGFGRWCFRVVSNVDTVVRVTTAGASSIWSRARCGGSLSHAIIASDGATSRMNPRVMCCRRGERSRIERKTGSHVANRASPERKTQSSGLSNRTDPGATLRPVFFGALPQ